jgi:phosphatidylserine/phosphatidylglycerophosphate/cardiolipin synthase-like enzyme
LSGEVGAQARTIVNGLSAARVEELAGEIFESLHDVMKRERVEADLFVDIPRPEMKASGIASVRAWRDAFFLEVWRFPLRPTLYFDPRAVTHEAYTSLHAKCVVIDERFALVTSANFTNRGQSRNVEVGALIEDASFARSLVEQWRSAVAAGLFVELDVFAA